MKSFYTVLMITISFLCTAQSFKKDLKKSGIVNKVLLNQLQLCHDQVSKKSYYNALENYEAVLEETGSNAYVLNAIGHTALLARDYSKAVQSYESLNNQFPEHQYFSAYFELGEAYKYVGQYQKALTVFSKFKRIRSHHSSAKIMKRWSRNSNRYCQYAANTQYQDSMFFRVKLLPEQINSPYTDFSPIAIDAEKVMFASLRKDEVQVFDYGEKHPHNINLYTAEVNEFGEWAEPVLQEGLVDEFDHVANGVFGPKNNLYYTKCSHDQKNHTICAIYSKGRDAEGQFLDKEKKLTRKINKIGFTSTQPTFGKVSKTRGKKTTVYDVMYFSSDRPGGIGGKDIWYSILHNDHFGTPVNCGKSINTVRDEVTPYYCDEEDGLYFSSNYHYGLGGFDVFFSKGKLKRFKRPDNAGIPFNSSYDDYYFTKAKEVDKDFGFFVSNRAGGFALQSEHCCDDIYRFEPFIPEKINLKVLVQDEVTGSPIDHAEVYFLSKYVWDKVGQKKSAIDYAKFKGETNVAGISLHEIYEHSDYHVFIGKEGYESATKTVAGDLKEILIELKRKSKAALSSVSATEHNSLKVIENLKYVSIPEKSFTDTTEIDDIEKYDRLLLARVHFPYNSDHVNKQSAKLLNDLHVFLEENVHVRIEVSGHTDDMGNKDFNQDLSERRAKTVVSYLVDLGLKSRRIKSKGCGQMQPIAPNHFADGKDNIEGRILNRRTEIRILHK